MIKTEYVTAIGYKAQQVSTDIYWYKDGEVVHRTKCYDQIELANALFNFLNTATMYNKFDCIVIGDNYSMLYHKDVRYILNHLLNSQLSLAIELEHHVQVVKIEKMLAAIEK